MTATTLPSLDELVDGVRAGNRAMLARSITLVESRRAEHRDRAAQLMQMLLPFTGTAMRVGITGVPGVGKSTTIDALGTQLLDQGHRVAVLAVDPSSSRTGGSILGDKTRMARLSMDERAFVRPSPASGTLGGVAAKTRETLLVCEAAGYDMIIIETVGVGQSETAVADMTDTFIVLMLPGAGDELQGIKKGVLELADIVAVNKADGDNVSRAQLAAAEYRGALHVLGPQQSFWAPPVLIYSALTGDGVSDILVQAVQHRAACMQAGAFGEKRQRQQVKWMWTLLDERLRERIRSDATLRARVPAIERQVGEGRLDPALAAGEIAALLAL